MGTATATLMRPSSHKLKTKRIQWLGWLARRRVRGTVLAPA